MVRGMNAENAPDLCPEHGPHNEEYCPGCIARREATECNALAQDGMDENCEQSGVGFIAITEGGEKIAARPA